MTRSRTSKPEDRIVAEQSAPQNLYRLFAVEPHGWSTVLLEDQTGSIFLATSARGDLVQISKQDSDRMLAERVYRLWQGDRGWSPLDALPLVASAFARHVIETEHEGVDASF